MTHFNLIILYSIEFSRVIMASSVGPTMITLDFVFYFIFFFSSNHPQIYTYCYYYYNSMLLKYIRIFSLNLFEHFFCIFFSFIFFNDCENSNIQRQFNYPTIWQSIQSVILSSWSSRQPTSNRHDVQRWSMISGIIIIYSYSYLILSFIRSSPRADPTNRNFALCNPAHYTIFIYIFNL